MPSHGHCNGCGPTDGFEEANKEFFNSAGIAEYYSEPSRVERARRLAAAMLKAYPFAEEETTVMDFACGTGLISRELAPHAKSIVGVDISQNMVDMYNLSVHNQGISPDEMRAVCISAIKEDDEHLKGMTFDVIVCASAYHHFPSIDSVTKTLVSYLKQGGSLLVADLMKDQSSHEVFSPDVHHIVPHRGGFTAEEIRNAFEGAGLHNFSFTEATKARSRHATEPVTLFIARGDVELHQCEILGD
ncbi:S-adenosyl-L-methionine-dependent methyltransferase [Pisolithus marmoratus]|nr:S-adenosyl-L-methionine-dependent methyltransferase [Pisolithus marmoratus]